MSKYKTIGPHVVSIPPGMEIIPQDKNKKEPVMVPIHEALNKAESDGWELVQIIDGFPINIPQKVSLLNKGPGFISLTGVCALVRQK